MNYYLILKEIIEIEGQFSMQSNEIKLTVGIPCFNNERTIADTITSLKNQTFKNWTCIISDNSTNDFTKQVVEKTVAGDERFQYVSNNENIGHIRNWNKLLFMTSTEYFKLLNADDLLFPNSIEIALAAIQTNSEFVLCTGKRSIINGDGKILQKSRGIHVKFDTEFDQRSLLRIFLRKGTNLFGETSFAVYRTDSFKLVGGYNSRFGFGTDLSSFFDVLDVGKMIYLNETLGAYRVWGGSASARSTKEERKELIDFAVWASKKVEPKISFLDLLLLKFMIPIKSKLRYFVYRFFS